MMAANDATNEERRTIVGIFEGAAHAERALTGLREAGIRPEQVSVIARDAEDRAALTDRDEEDEGAAGGAVTGGMIGGLAGFLIGISALVIPGIGPIVGSGIIVATLAGAGLGAAAGGLVGALTAQGVPEEEAEGYQTQVQGGRILLTVHADSDEEARTAQRVLRRHQGDAVRAYGTGAAQAAMAHLSREPEERVRVTPLEDDIAPEPTPDIEGETSVPTSTSVGGASGIGMGPGAAATLTDTPTGGGAREAERRS
jgi:hypothetical protein